MRRFRFVGDQIEKHTSYLINFSVGECYNEERKAFRDSPLTIQDAALMYPKDWQEVFDKPNNLHKDTDLGCFTMQIVSSLLTTTPFVKPTADASNEKFVSQCIELAKELIKQLDNEVNL